MAKKIFISPEEIDNAVQSAQARLLKEGEALKKRKFCTGEQEEIAFKFKLDEKSDDRKAKVLFAPIAWAKMTTLVMKYTTEIEWHGTVERTGEASWVVKDILIFPHTVTGSTVESNQREYEAWLDSLDDATFNKLRFHGHSHVNMGVTPSAVDMGYRVNVINNFANPVEGSDYFYIFMIINKRGELSCQVYDLQNNALYTKDSRHSEVEIDVCNDDGDSCLSEFVTEVRKVVRENSYHVQPYGYEGPHSLPVSSWGGQEEDIYADLNEHGAWRR